MEYYAVIKRKEILPFATMWMELEGIIPGEISQSEKDNYHKISLIMRNLRGRVEKVGKEKMKQDGIGRETNHKRLLISQNKRRVAGGGGIWRGGVGLWTLGRVCAIVSAVKCVSLMIHRPVPLGLIIHSMLIF